MILKHISPLISPELMKVLMEMGHGDEIAFADRNFPAVSNAKRLITYSGVGIQELLHAVLYHFPIDYAVEKPVKLMRIPPTSDYKGDVVATYQTIVDSYHGSPVGMEMLERQEFYTRASQAYAIVATSDSARFANIIIRKGIVPAT
ncbi:RbsD/FucU family protein [Sphaerochaeta sp. PS]|uniref:RbsD/FucU family protein n=1 Tax=Sphaerochaeta sp. PS TaxID=3076336 RepID=UPI0028A50F1B|nr:RbsD/FucU domain-containing protein [Sphaerochaeta sp. PS]MDT4763050.1 RbsD/FucU domain-containing protein [Sphaerochaeta sp. PS]